MAMSETIEKRLADLGVTLPAAAAPAGSYVPFVQSGKLLFTAGQLPLKDGKLQATGLLGRDLDTAAGKEAAKLCAINILAQAKAALGDLEQDPPPREDHASSSPRRPISPSSISLPTAPPIFCSPSSASRQACPRRCRHGVAAAQRCGRNRSYHRSRVSIGDRCRIFPG